MAFYADTKTTARPGFIARGLESASELLHRMALRSAERQMVRQTFNELSTLSDAELADIGLHRSEIGRVARDAVR